MQKLLLAALTTLVVALVALAFLPATGTDPAGEPAAAEGPAGSPGDPGDPVDTAPVPEPTAAAATGALAAQDESDPDCREDVSETRPIDRLWGDDRYATAACVSEVGYPEGAATALLARGDTAGGWADALAGTVLAHAVGGPVLLTEPDALPDATRAELERLEPDVVLILGGTSAVSRQVADDVVALGPEVERVEGRDRAETAVAIAERAGAGPTVFVVNGHRPADALVAGAVAARAGAALLMVNEGSVPAVTEAALEGADQVVVVGGFAVVGEAAEARLRQVVGANKVRRVAGGSRDETAASVARTFPAEGRIHLASGVDRHLVDAIPASWLAARAGSGPVLYAQRDRPGHGTDRYLRLGGLDVEPVRLVGGPAVLGDDLVAALEQRYDEAAAGGPPAEVRAFWVQLFDDDLKTRAGIEKVLDDAAAGNFNAVIAQVVRRHDAYYVSDGVIPRTPDPKMPPDLDLLARLVPAAHARGLEVHAWFVIGPAYHGVYSSLTLPPDHVYREHGPGTGAQSWMTFHHDGSENPTYLDPGVEGVQQHAVDMIHEVVERYDVDGVHTDYVRYDGAAFGYNPQALARFNQETGRTGRPVPSDAQWSGWRRAQTQELSRQVYEAVKAVDPSVVVSAAVIAQGAGPSTLGGFQLTRAYVDKFQDWPAWLQAGVIDAALPMVYFREANGEHARWFRDWTAFSASLTGSARTVAVGQASYLNTVAQSLDQLGIALDSTDGVALFSYQQDSSSSPRGTLLAALRGSRFADPAPTPWRP